MNLSTGNGGGARRDSGQVRVPRGRSSTRVKPACEALEGRQLLSTTAAPPVVLPTPPAAAVANAAADLNTLDPTTFAQYELDLARAESHSHVTAAPAGAWPG